QQLTIDSGVRPQTVASPALTALKRSAGAAGADFQQVMVPSVRTPHVKSAPARICLKVPVGAESCPAEVEPQHPTVPSARMPQACDAPTVRLRYPTRDGWENTMGLEELPPQKTPPAVRSAH